MRTSRDKRNVLCIVPSMVMGGAEKVLLNIAMGTDRKRYSFHIVTTVPAKNVWHDRFIPHFQNIVIPTRRVENEDICHRYLRVLVEKLGIDAVLISNSTIGYEYLPRLKSEFGHVGIVDILHTDEFGGASDELRWAVPYIDRRICISNQLAENLVKKYRIHGIGDEYIRRLEVIHNGIDTREYNPNTCPGGRFKSRFEIPNEGKIISFVGRFSGEKDPLLFIDVARRVLERSPDCGLKFVMVGDGPLFDDVITTLRRYGIKDHFILTGPMDNILELLSDTHILLVVSNKEGIPFVILESMAMEVPVISTDVGAVPEVIEDAINGYLIDLDSDVVEGFTTRILDLLSRNETYSELAEKARETIVSRYSIESTAAEYQSVLDELLAPKTP